MIAANINGNETTSDYFLRSPQASPSPDDAMNAVKQTGSSYVSVIGPDEDFVAAAMLVVTLIVDN